MVVLSAGLLLSMSQASFCEHIGQCMIESDNSWDFPTSDGPIRTDNDHCLLQSGGALVSRVTVATGWPELTSSREHVWDLDTDFVTDKQEEEQLANQGRQWALEHEAEIRAAAESDTMPKHDTVGEHSVAEEENGGVEEHGAMEQGGAAEDHVAVGEHGAMEGHGAVEGHGSAAEHGGGHGGGHEGGQSTVMAWLLLGSIAFIMIIFYMVNSSDSDIRKATWAALSSTISIFCSVLIFNGTKEVSVDFFGDSPGDHHAPPTLPSLCISFVRLTLFLIVVHTMLIIFRTNKWFLKVCGTMGAHVVGFAAIDAFGGLQQFAPFRNTPALSSLVIPVTVFALILSWLVAGVLRRLLVRALGTRCEDAEVWDKQCELTENEFAGLVVGLIVSLVVRFFITGHLSPVHGAPRGKTKQEIWLLGSASACLGVLVVVMTELLAGLKQEGAGQLSKRIARVTLSTLAMSMGFCTLYWGQWFFWNSTSGRGVGDGDKMTARMVMAMVFSVLVFGAVYAVDSLADRAARRAVGLRELIGGLVLTLGLSWEAAFLQAFEGVGNSYEDHFAATVADVVLTGFLCGLVMPAWALYILPHAVEED